MLQKIKSRLDEYLEFDSDLLFKDNSEIENKINVKRLIRIFGGSIRDIIADMPINDIDILSGAKSIKPLEELLKSKGYFYAESLIPKDLSSIYHDIKVINEPHTWIKGNKIIQIIRPVQNYLDSHYNKEIITSDIYERGFVNLIQNVDISCCGVSYDGVNLYENYPQSILHCKYKVFESNKNAMMYSSNRFLHRKYKLEDRGWQELSTDSEFREFKLNYLLEDVNFDYVSEYRKDSFFKKYEKVTNFSKSLGI